MGAAGAAHAAGFGLAGALGGVAGRAGGGGGEDGKLLGKPGGAAGRAFGPFPMGGADEQLGVAVAGFAMEFVNRHGMNLRGGVEKLKRDAWVA